MRKEKMVHTDTEEEVAFELFCLEKYVPAQVVGVKGMKKLAE